MEFEDCQDCISLEKRNDQYYCIELDEYIEDINMCPEHDYEIEDGMINEY